MDAIHQQRIVFRTNAMADDIEEKNHFDDLMANRTECVQQEHVFDDPMANWTEEKWCGFTAAWDNDEGFLDIDSR